MIRFYRPAYLLCERMRRLEKYLTELNKALRNTLSKLFLEANMNSGTFPHCDESLPMDGNHNCPQFRTNDIQSVEPSNYGIFSNHFGGLGTGQQPILIPNLAPQGMIYLQSCAPIFLREENPTGQLQFPIRAGNAQPAMPESEQQFQYFNSSRFFVPYQMGRIVPGILTGHPEVKGTSRPTLFLLLETMRRRRLPLQCHSQWRLLIPHREQHPPMKMSKFHIRQETIAAKQYQWLVE
ncbi:Hypothetical predicted protein [Cloeon dipterum]|uniref:Uncharacterized protein n=1 Tax=Cloeon dipterum TaxID=197152 RepID=A0A8S1DU78_9INSE|nr:Hypothetical predicted protein [Cloeon dipterum]